MVSRLVMSKQEATVNFILEAKGIRAGFSGVNELVRPIHFSINFSS